MRIELVCLGVGGGGSYVLKGIPSTSFVLMINNEPYLLIDCGAGSALSYQKIIGQDFPKRIFVTHNHMDHTGDLPIVALHIKKTTNQKPYIYGYNKVLDIIKKHRFHELILNSTQPNDLAIWISQNDSNQISIDEHIHLKLYRSIHSYLCYGFVLYYKNDPILAYSADSDFDRELYDYLTEAPIVIVDGRELGNQEHASFEEISSYFGFRAEKKIRVVHYESTEFVFPQQHIQFFREGDRLFLFEV